MVAKRCFVCGGEIGQGQVVRRVTQGKFKDGAVSNEKEYGIVHDNPCFFRAVNAPSVVLERIRALSAAPREKDEQGT